MSEVKFFRIVGFMLIGHDRFPRWQKFVKEVRALSKEHALERVYSEIGGDHKVKRRLIKIIEVREIPVEEVTERQLVWLTKVKRLTVK